MNIKENVSLKEHTTMGVGGSARYFVKVDSIHELKEALEYLSHHKLPLLVLAGGSNLIISDAGFSGLVIKPVFKEIRFNRDQVLCGSGVVMDDLVKITTSRGLSGLEWAGGLPGTVGGAVRGNAGAFKSEIKDSILVTTSCSLAGEKILRDVSKCQFGYRTSIYKQLTEIIVEATFKFKSDDPEKLIHEANEHRKFRKERHPLEYGNSGSIFKNVAIEKIKPEYLASLSSQQKNDPFPVIPAAFILSETGLKGFKIGQAQISEKHPNFIINLGKAKSEDIIQVINTAVARVKEKYNIDLEVEPQLVGFNTKFPWESK